MNGYITLAIAITTVGLFYWAWLNFKIGVKTLRWIRIEGEVVSSSVERSGTTIEFDHPTYLTNATVKYEVAGKIYLTSRVDDFVGTFESIGKTKSFPIKSKVSVFYNPEKPFQATLDRAALRFAIILSLLGVGFIALEWHWVARTYF